MIGVIKDKKPIGNKSNGFIVTFNFMCPMCYKKSEGVYSIKKLGTKLKFSRRCQNCNSNVKITELF